MIRAKLFFFFSRETCHGFYSLDDIFKKKKKKIGTCILKEVFGENKLSLII